MRLHHPLRRSLLAVLAALALFPLAHPTPAGAAETVKTIVFPVDGNVSYTDTFGACRDGCSRSHQGQDLMGKKMQPLLAAVDGVVSRVVFSNSTGNSVVIKASDGWTYHYIHVNNDTPGTDDGKATRSQAFPSWVVLGASVKRGSVIGYLGDSGNAEGTAPHLHFEIRMPPAAGSYTGTAINPYESLRRAVVWSRDPHWELRRTATAGPVEDQISFGVLVGDRGLLCDWDGDGIDEPVIVRSGVWYLRSSLTSTTTARTITFGSVSEQPLCDDIDGDGADEPVLFRNGGWSVRSSFDAEATVARVAYGTTGDRPALGDWDDDADADLAVHRKGTWYLRSGSGRSGSTVRTVSYGTLSGDLPVVGDWDGDGRDDLGIFRSGGWHLRSSSLAAGSTVRSFVLGRAGDQPVVGLYVPGTGTGMGVYRARSG